MSVVRKIFALIFFVLLIFGLEYLKTAEFYTSTIDVLIALGFILLIGLLFGEILSLIGFPKISGYLIAGILFGPYSKNIFQIDYLSFISDYFLNELKYFNALVLSLIAFLIGGRIKLNELKELKRTITLIIIIRTILIIAGIFLLFVIIYPYFDLLKQVNLDTIIFIGLLISILMISTSIETTFGVLNEFAERNRLSKLIFSSSVLKDLIALILIIFVINLSYLLKNGESELITYSTLSSGFKELLFSIAIGFAFGFFLNVYFKQIEKEKLLFFVSFLVLSNALVHFLRLEPFAVYLIAGIAFANLSNEYDDFLVSVEKYSQILLIILFTIIGASLNINFLYSLFPLVILILSARVLITYFSVKVAAKYSSEDKEIQKNLWMGFLSNSLILSYPILISNVSSNVLEILLPIVFSLNLISLLIGAPLLKFGLKKINKSTQSLSVVTEKRFEDRVREEVLPHKKFNVPQFEDRNLNELVLSLREKLISHLQEFEQTLINKRSEEALEFYYQVVEQYIEEYQKLRNLFTKGKVSGKEIKVQVLSIQQEISKWFAEVSVARKSVEQQILTAEYLLQELFDELKEYCENSPLYVEVEQEEDKYEKESDDNLFVQSVKSYKRLDKKFRKLFGIKSFLKRKIPYVTLVKYYFEYQIALEMEKVAFLLGLERLNVLRKVKSIYDDFTSNLEELINLIAEHKDVEAVSLLAVDKLDEIHGKLKQEISSIGEEIEASNKNISLRLNYAFANPFNQFLKSILKAGTIELNIKKFHFSKIYDETNKAKETTLETIRFWVNYLVGFLGICERDARTFEIIGKINAIINDTMISHSDNVAKDIKDLISELNVLFKSLEKQITNSELISSSSIVELKNLILKYRDDIIYLINEKGISKLSASKKTYSVNNIVNSLKDTFAQIITEYNREIKVLDEKDLELKETKTRYIELKTLKFVEIIKNYFENEILQEIIRLNEIVNGHISSSILELKNIENVIYYHFNITIDELSNLESSQDSKRWQEEISSIIENNFRYSIKLLRDKIKAWDRQIEKFEREVEVSLTEKIYSQISNLKEVFRKELSIEFEKGLLPQEYEKILLTINKKLSNIKNQVFTLGQKLLQSIKKLFRPFIREEKYLIEKEIEGKSLIISIYDQTVFDEKVFNSLPFVYKKLFDYTSSDVVEILVGRENEKEILKQAYERTLKGLSGSTAIIGESGTGKSSLISSFISKIQTEIPIYRYEFEKTTSSEKEFLKILSDIFEMNYITSFDELISELTIETNSKIVILEDIHKIYLRKFGGLEAMKKLLLTISETSNKIFWIVSISYHAWQLLNRILNIGNYFPFQIKTEVLSKEQIKQALLNRHKTSGYNLEFLPDDSSLVQNQRHYLFKHDRQAALEEEFFNKLYEACEGNITSALFYWIKSIKEFKNNTIYIKPILKLDFRLLQSFEIDKLLTLSNLIQHGSLTIKEHQEIFKYDEEKSKSILNFLSAANLVHYDMNEKGEKVFYLNSAVYKPIEIELRKLNIFD
ncbi:MAG: cation:proton antiporter [Ignavibacteria bacterium]|nr:cation:proton antiporter [Ignavibacteria bacterium]